MKPPDAEHTYGHGKIEKWPGATRAVDEYLALCPNQGTIYYPEVKKYYLQKHG